MSVPRNQIRELQRQRRQFQTSYTYGPARPEYPFITRGTTPTSAPPSRRLHLIPVFVTLAIIGGGVGIGGKLLGGETKSSAQPQTHREQKVLGDTQTVETIKQPVVETTSTTEMANAINAVIAAHKEINTSVSITDLSSDESYNYGLDVKFEAASTGKMVSAIALLQQVEAGKIKLTDKLSGQPASDLLTAMIEVSDNNAWAAINAKVGHKTLQNTANAIGMTTYTNADNQMKSRDLAILLTKLYQGKLLNKSDQALLLGHMKNANKTVYIPSALPGGLNVYHKSGWLEDRSHDGVIIDNGSHPYVIVVFTRGSDEESRIKVLHEVANASIAHFIGKDAAAQVANN